MKYSIHEVANLFPMMSDEEFSSLVEDIKENGQREPITVYENQIIDGRNRFKACEQLGIEPDFREWNGQGSPTTFVISMNLKRRHLTASQKSAIYPEMSLMYEREAKARQIRKPVESVPQKVGGLQEGKHDGEATAQASKILGVNRQYLSDAKKIHENAPELIPMMKSGELNINRAKNIAAMSPEAREKLLDNLPKQEDGKTKACTVCGELLPIEKMNGAMCYPCKNIKYKKPNAAKTKPEQVVVVEKPTNIVDKLREKVKMLGLKVTELETRCRELEADNHDLRNRVMVAEAGDIFEKQRRMEAELK